MQRPIICPWRVNSSRSFIQHCRWKENACDPRCKGVALFTYWQCFDSLDLCTSDLSHLSFSRDAGALLAKRRRHRCEMLHFDTDLKQSRTSRLVWSPMMLRSYPSPPPVYVALLPNFATIASSKGVGVSSQLFWRLFRNIDPQYQNI